MSKSTNNSIGSRVLEAEQQIATLAASQASLANQVGSLAESVSVGFNKTDLKIDALSDKLGNVGRPKWEAMGIMFTVSVAVLGWFVTSHVAPLVTEIAAIRDRVNQVQTDIGDLPARMLRLESLYERSERRGAHP